MKNKIAKSNGILYKIRNFLDRKTLTHLYNSFVLPYLIYGIEVWGNTNAVHLDPIIKIQKKIVRTITFSHYLAHTVPIFDTLNILNFNNLVVHRICLMMFKYSKDLVPLPIVELFTRNYELHNHYTRQSQSLQLQLAETKRSTKLLHFMAFEFGITYLQKSQLMFRMPVLNILRNYLSKIIQFHIE